MYSEVGVNFLIYEKKKLQFICLFYHRIYVLYIVNFADIYLPLTLSTWRRRQWMLNQYLVDSVCLDDISYTLTSSTSQRR